MELQVFISKKGTKVVLATDLHQVLQLTDHHYATNVRQWLKDIYQFSDGIRRPEALRDYAKRNTREGGLLDDYYLSVELAKLIALNSRSRLKQKYAAFLLKHEQDTERAQVLSPDEVLRLMELIKAMSLVSCQLAVEEAHLALYRERNEGSADYWRAYRAELVGFKKEDLRRKLRASNQSVQEKATTRDLLQRHDPQELIRIAIIDHFISIGKSPDFAREMGDLAKQLAREMKIDIIDDRQTGGSLFAPQVDPDLIHRLKQPARIAAA